MKSDFVQFVIALLVLAVGGAVEELAPTVLGVGVPVLLIASVFFATRRPPFVALLFALSAGAVEDSLSGLPGLTSVSLFVLAAVAARFSRLPSVCMAVVYPLFQLWLWLWVSGLSGGIFGRVLVSFPVGLMTAFATSVVLVWLDRKGAVGED